MLVENNVQKLRWPAKKSYRPLVETQGSCTAAATKSQEAQACYSSDVCGHSTTAYSKTPLLRPPFVPSKRGLNSGMVLNLADVKVSNLKT